LSLNERFDVIYCGDIIEHLEDFSGFLSSCKAHLSRDGIIIISTPNPWYWKNVVRAAVLGRVNPNPEHTCWFCPTTLAQLAARHDLEVTDLSFGSRYRRDLLIPLPRGVKHTTFQVVLRPKAVTEP
jgi:2-polyprenyl-3-methyl-5-hydroxy-6-metoxy-1,4-benzoquinol methylase